MKVFRRLLKYYILLFIIVTPGKLKSRLSADRKDGGVGRGTLRADF